MNRILVKGADNPHCFNALAKAGYPAQAIEKLQFVEIKQFPVGNQSQWEARTQLTLVFEGKPLTDADKQPHQTLPPRIRVFEGYLTQPRFELIRSSGGVLLTPSR